MNRKVPKSFLLDGRIAVLEIAGIPYARKTSIIFEMERQTKAAARSGFHFVEEFRGDSASYNRSKTTSLINVRRAFHSARLIRHHCREGDVKLIVFDRGIWDSLVWLDRFATESDLTRSAHIRRSKARLLKMFESCVSMVDRYYVAWIDEDPLLANARHNRQGKIINLRNLEHLRDNYSFAFENSQLSHVTLMRVDPKDRENRDIAELILQKFKLQFHTHAHP